MSAIKNQTPNETAVESGTQAVRPLVAIVGRQNVGKSTLLNRLAGRRIAIVEDLPGTTRDRLSANVNWLGHDFTLIDTGGVESKGSSFFSDDINRQVDTAISEAAIILFLVDAKDGILPSDQDIAAGLRPVKERVILVANKADNEKADIISAELHRFGLGEPITISAYHGRGINDLLDAILKRLPQAPSNVAVASDNNLKIAIVGRPNVGKSMMLNRLLGQERVIVSEIPGTTRDAIDTVFDFEEQSIILIDTAGIKRRGHQGEGVDKYSVIRSLDAIDRSDVVLLVLDAEELVTAQDLHVAGYLQQAYKGIVIVINKWDLAKNLNKSEVASCVRANFKFMKYAPVLYTSAKDGSGISDVIPQALNVYRERLKRIGTGELNSTVQQVLAKHTPPHKGSRILKFLYVTQAEVNPPTFVFFVNDVTLMHFSYQRYLENQLRNNFGFNGTPLRLIFKTRGK
ncbi:MAG: ribosome biogenesis GTPase Der [Dehalococcoidia bacterium]|nr:ribosome biogenesis GTPase Der [Dehalococcoidia bacterium]